MPVSIDAHEAFRGATGVNAQILRPGSTCQGANSDSKAHVARWGVSVKVLDQHRGVLLRKEGLRVELSRGAPHAFLRWLIFFGSVRLLLQATVT